MSTEMWIGLLLLFPVTPWLAAWSMRWGSDPLREREERE